MVNNLGPAPIRSEAAGDVMSAERALILEELQSRAYPTSCSELAEQLQLHTNTVRLHMQALVERGLAEGVTQSPRGRGRPAQIYRALPQNSEPDKRVREVIGLATVLAGYVKQHAAQPAQEARKIGAEWAHTFEDDPATSSRVAQIDPVETAIDRLDQLGFAPHPVEGDKGVYELRRCPLLDVAKRNSDVVCNVHLGLVQGTLDRFAKSSVRAELEPFAVPGACLLRLHT